DGIRDYKVTGVQTCALPIFVAAVRGDEPEGARFAEAMGYRAFHERIDSYVDVPSFDPSGFDDPDATAARAGVRLATYAELLREQIGRASCRGSALHTAVRAS